MSKGVASRTGSQHKITEKANTDLTPEIKETVKSENAAVIGNTDDDNKIDVSSVHTSDLSDSDYGIDDNKIRMMSTSDYVVDFKNKITKIRNIDLQVIKVDN